MTQTQVLKKKEMGILLTKVLTIPFLKIILIPVIIPAQEMFLLRKILEKMTQPLKIRFNLRGMLY